MTTFLYVEDDPNSRQVVQILLTQVMGFTHVTIFEDSTDFTTRLHALPYVPDIIFLDIHMAPHDGYEVLRMIRAEPKYAGAIIVAMTAGVMSSDVTELQQAGFDGMIGKPIRKRVFPELLERLLSGESVWFTA